MKKTYSFLFLFFCLLSTNAQTIIDCASGRYDTEVFSAVTTTSNVTYGSNINSSGFITQLTMDIYEPTGDTALMRPLIVWVHGGSFVTGTKIDNDMVALCNRFAKRGYVCASINYRLGIPIPANQQGATQAVYRAVQDMKAAIRYFRKDAATANIYKIDPMLVIAGGSSAGAFTAMHLAYLDEVSEIPADIDTVALGNLEGDSGNPGYSSDVSAVVNLCGALGNKTYIHPTDEPLCSMHGTADQVVPYSTATIYLFGAYPLMVVDGSYAINEYADLIGLPNVMYTYFGSDHVPYLSNTSYMDTTVQFVSNFLYSQLGCTPSNLNPLPNTFISTGIAVVSSNEQVEVFPNPASDRCMVRCSEDIQNITLYDATGRAVIVKYHVDEQEMLLDLQGLSKGVYQLSITAASRQFIKKLAVE
jgi:dienelactone hydrolase